ncbi:hypothetical protein MKEN_00485800 [Mycena kentingensis (nom. inval.)]|nr:hypothetical protein MKEN_00485800 [Mycena kentingensis (nom. inval.)]
MATDYERVPTESCGIDDDSESLVHKPGTLHTHTGARCLVPALLSIIAAQALALILFASSSYGLMQRPALGAIEEHVLVYPLGFEPDLSDFQIPSSPELDAKWEDLYSFGVSRIPQAQAALIPNVTSRIPGDPDGYYIIGLDVFHQLHCLVSISHQLKLQQKLIGTKNMVRMALDPLYYPDWDIYNPANAENATTHVSHCVDWIRQSIMCHGDTSVLVWQWNETKKVTAPKATVPHVCRKFEILKEWGKEHRLLGKFDDSIRMDG